MRALIFRSFARIGFFNQKPPRKTEMEELEEFIANSKSLGYVVDNIKKLNKDKPKLLPPQRPEHQGKLTVVMEIDEVLSYTFTPDDEGYLSAPLRRHDIYHEFDEYDALLTIYKRKNLENFINYISEECEPVIWSTGVKAYVNLMKGFLDPQNKIPYVLNQEACNLVDIKQQQIDTFVKDLDLLGRDLSKVVYLDCKPFSYWLNPENCLPLEEFRADSTMQSEDLNEVLLSLESLKKYPDVREVLDSTYQVKKYLKEAKLL